MYEDEIKGGVHIENDPNAGQAHNRFLDLVGTTLATDVATATWEADEAVTSVRFKVEGGTAGDMVRIVFDATPVDDNSDTSQAEAWLTPVAASAQANTDVEYIEVKQGDADGIDEWSEPKDFGAALRRCDAIAVNAAVTLFIEVV